MEAKITDRTENSAVISFSDTKMRISASDRFIIRITETQNDRFISNDYNILTKEGENLSFPCSVADDTDEITFSTGKLILTLRKSDCHITIRRPDGTVLLEKDRTILDVYPLTRNVWNGTAVISENKNVDGARADAEGCEKEFVRNVYSASFPLSFDAGEGIYGLGSSEEGYSDLKGKLKYVYQENLRAMVPALVSSLNYELLFNCGCSMIFDDKTSHTLKLECVDEADWFFISGDSRRDVIKGYYKLTGIPPLLPRYAFGYIQSKERYRSADELCGIVREYRERKIPLDVIVQDWLSWRDGQWGQKSFDPERFPDPDAMTNELHGMNARLMLSIWPIMTGESKNRTEFLQSGLMLGNQANYNAFLPEARALYWKQAKEGLFDHGIDAWWCDCTEPFEADWQEKKPEPESTRYELNTGYAEKYLDKDRISLYSLYHSQGIYEGMRSSAEKRVLNLTRSSYAGQHRYGTITWSGDTSATWNVMKRHIAEGLNFMTTGEPYWTFDTGAFFVADRAPWFWSGDYPEGVNDSGYRELFVRWLEYAAFTPMMRAHGTDTPREIWRFGEKGSVFYDAIAKYIRLRYTILPYVYSLSAAVTFDGGQMTEHPGLRYPGDPVLRDIKDQYFFGDLMVCPVCEPMYYEAGSKPIENKEKMRNVYLPDGIWYDFYSGEKIGSGTFPADAPLDKIPVYVPAGTILPIGPVMQYSGEIADPEITFTVYPGKNGKFTFYSDDGETYAYEKGEYEMIQVKWDDENRTLTFSERKGNYKGMPEKRKFSVCTAGGEKTEILYTGNEINIGNL